MSEFTDDDVAAGVKVLDESWDDYGDGARRILATVAPVIAARALREAEREQPDGSHRFLYVDGNHCPACAAYVARAEGQS